MDIGQKIAKYKTESEKAIQAVSEKLKTEISSIRFQIALGEVLGYDDDDSTQVLNHELTAQQMLDLLKGYAWNIPEELASIEFEESILPQETPRLLTEQTIKNKGEIWVIHKNDADPFPSNPHAHNKETGYKLHLGNGDLYSKKNHPLGQKISKKHLLAIRDKVNNITLPALLV